MQEEILLNNNLNSRQEQKGRQLTSRKAQNKKMEDLKKKLAQLKREAFSLSEKIRRESELNNNDLESQESLEKNIKEQQKIKI